MRQQVEQLGVSYIGENPDMQHLAGGLPVPVTVVRADLQRPLTIETIDRIRPLAATLIPYLHDSAHAPTERQMVDELADGPWLFAYHNVVRSGDRLPAYPLAFARLSSEQGANRRPLLSVIGRRDSADIIFEELGVTSGRDVRSKDGWLDQIEPMRHLAGSVAMLNTTVRALHPDKSVYIRGRWSKDVSPGVPRDKRTGFLFQMCGFKPSAAPEGRSEQTDGSTYMVATAAKVREKLDKNFVFSLPRRIGS